MFATFAGQRNARIHAGIGATAVAAGLLLRLSTVEWAVLVLTIAAVFAAELANTAIETIVDIVSPGYSEWARMAKDAAAGAVLIAAAGSVAVGLLIFVPRLLRLL